MDNETNVVCVHADCPGECRHREQAVLIDSHAYAEGLRLGQLRERARIERIIRDFASMVKCWSERSEREGAETVLTDLLAALRDDKGDNDA